MDVIYLDNAATSYPKPDIVHETVCEFYSKYGVNPGRTGCDLALTAEKMINDTRKSYSEFFNQSLYANGGKKDHNRLVFTMNATMSLNIIINGMIKPGDHIVTSILEHNSVIRPVNHKVEDGAEATYVVPDDEGYLNPDDIKKAIKPNTKLVIINHASNVTGVLQDIKTIGAICKEAGVPFALDSAQTAGVLPIDMVENNISFLSFTGHKGLFAPTGTGGICVADDAEIGKSIYGGTGVRSADPLHLDEYPYRLEAGTLNLAGISGLYAGLNWVKEKGLNDIYNHEIELIGMLMDGLREIKGITIYGPKGLKNRVATLSVTLENYDPSDVGTILDIEYGIQTRTGLHCAPLIHKHHGTVPRGTVRFSCGPFTTKEDIETTIKAMHELAADRPS